MVVTSVQIKFGRHLAQ